MTEPLRLPNLIIAGAAKAGTTSLFSYLAQHPDISPSSTKETRYFDPLRFGEPLEPVSSYAAHFRSWTSERYAVESSPGYLHGGAVIARAIRQTCPDPRVLIILRSPADRCWSYFRYVRSRASIPPNMDFESYLDRCAALHARGLDRLRENRSYLGLGGGCYSDWLGEWWEEFGSHVKVCYFDDLNADAAGTVKAICGWLGLDSDAVDGFDLAVENRTEQIRNRAAQRLALWINRQGERFFREHPAVKRRLRGAYYLVNRERASLRVSPAAAQRMTDFYRPYEDRLASQLQTMGMAQPPWQVHPTRLGRA